MTKNVFVESINMETQTVFHNNGSINIYPCDFELGQHIVSGGTVASQKGRMTTDDDGRSKFVPYAQDSGSRYEPLFDTAHGEVKATKQSVVIIFRFPKKLGKTLIEALFAEESKEVKAFIKTRNTITEW